LTPTNPIELNSNNISGVLTNEGTDRPIVGISRNEPAEAHLINSSGDVLGPDEAPDKVYIP
jgi:hypothetical protein